MSTYKSADFIINEALRELGLPKSNLTNTTNDATAYQMLGILNSLGAQLLRVHDWQLLEKVMTFTGNGTDSTFPLPADYGRQVNQTQWATSDKRPLLGPTSPQVWSWCQYGIVSVGIYFRYRLLDGEYNIFPVPGAGEEFALYYISKNWVQTPGVDPAPPTYTDIVTTPDQIPLFDDRLMIAGVKLKFWAQKGFETTLLQQEFDYLLANETAQNQGAAMINLSSNRGNYLLGWGNIQDGNWNQ